MKEFTPFRLDPVNQCLWRRGDAQDERIPLTPKAFAMLTYLVEHADRLVTQNELLEALWPDTYVQPEVLKSHILDIRNALGDSAKHPRFIQTLTRRGYQFIAPVTDPAMKAKRTPEPPFGKLVGRDAPRAELSDCLKRSLQNQRQIVFVTGEPGIGKTAVTDEFVRRCAAEFPGVRVARGQCVEGYGSNEAYYPVLEALGELCGGSGGDAVVQILARQAPTWLVQFPALVKREQRETLQREILGATRERMLREISEALETISLEKPLVLLLEDLHWVDPSTVDLISAMARRRAPGKLILIGTYRPVDIALSDHPLKAVKQELLVHRLCREIALQPLEEAEVAEYLAIELPGLAVPEGLAGLIYRHSEGNPLFMVAVLEHLRQRKLITLENGRWKTTIPIEDMEVQAPDNLAQIIESQITRLSNEQQRALETGSIAGTVFSAAVVAPAANLSVEEFENVCDGLTRRHQIVRSADPAEFPDGTASERYEFVHSLYRDVLYNRQPAGRRAKLHLSIGARLEEICAQRPHEVAPELAEHFERGGDWLRAVTCLRQVAETAGRRYAPREAAAALHQAVELSRRLPEAQRASIETEVLTKLAKLYFVSFDMRAVETCEILAARAAHYGLVDVEVGALIDMAYPLSWISSDRCLKVLERTLELSARQNDPLMRARTRASCLVRRIWANGWNARDADDCRQAVAEIRRAGDPFVIASHVIDYNFIQWAASEYREARRNAVESLAILLDGVPQNRYLSSAHWLSEFILPWSLLFLGEWGAMLQEIRAGIAMADRNGDSYRAQTLRVYQAWLHLKAMDFAGVVEICDSLLPSFGDPPRTPWRRFCLNLLGSGHTALGNYEAAEQHLTTLRVEMEHLTVIHDWYRRMELQLALAELYLANGDVQKAHVEAENFLQVTQATAERTWQALAWEANARVAMAENDFSRARDSIAAGLSTMEGFEVPLANWRVHATAAELYARLRNRDLAEHHRESSSATILQLANSLPADEPLRQVFLSSATVQNILGDRAEEPELDAKRA